MKNNTTKEYVIAKENSAVNTYTLSAEELAKYETPSKRENKPVYTACGKEVVNREKTLPRVPKREYMPKEYGISDNDLFELGKRTGYNAMKSKYNKRGLEDYNPNKNISALEEFEGNSLLAVVECIADTMLELDSEGKLSDDNMHDIRKACYKACERDAYIMKREAMKHLYIEDMKPNEDGETPITEIEDVTAHIEKELDFELWELLKPYTTIQDRKILKYIAKGYTYETIASRLRCSKTMVFKRVKKARAHAQKALKDTDFMR